LNLGYPTHTARNVKASKHGNPERGHNGYFTISYPTSANEIIVKYNREALAFQEEVSKATASLLTEIIYPTSVNESPLRLMKESVATFEHFPSLFFFFVTDMNFSVSCIAAIEKEKNKPLRKSKSFLALKREK